MLGAPRNSQLELRGSRSEAGQDSAAPISLLCPVIESESQSNQWNFIFIGIFPVIKKKNEISFTLKKYCQDGLKQAAYLNSRERLLKSGWTLHLKRVLLSLCATACHLAITSMLCVSVSRMESDPLSWPKSVSAD